LEKAMEIFADGEALFVDARDPDLFQLGHIPGAVNLPVRNFEQVFPKIEEQLLAAPRVITYCGGDGCDTSIELTERLLLAGLYRVEVFTGGMEEWQAAGNPIE
jgi:rhodanese-related sulfurtransferase